MSKAAAARAYEEFHGDPPDRVVVGKLPDKDVTAWHLGRMTIAGYETVRDGKPERYMHEFAPGCGPDIAVGPDGEAYLTGGAYDVTDSGFEDNEMPNLILLNPRKRGQAAKVATMSTGRKRHRTGRNAKGQFVKKARSAPRRARAPTYAANPVRKSRKRGARRASAARPIVIVREGGSVKKRRRGYRSNPIARTRRHGGKSLNIRALIVPAAMQSVGAVATTALFNVVAPYLANVSPNLVSGQIKGISKALTGVALGMLVAKMGQAQMGQYIAEGAITIGVYDAISSWVPDTTAPMSAMYQANMGAMYRGNLRSMPAYRGNMGAMIAAPPPGGRSNFGWATAAQTTAAPTRGVSRFR
jgi:hypothetical protein